MVENRYQHQLSQLTEEKRYRKLTDLFSHGGGNVSMVENEQSLLNLSSNDYLGLSGDVSLLEEFYQDKLEKEPDSLRLGAASSRLLTGSSNHTRALEEEIASKYGRNGALLFNSGYHANIGVLPALTKKGDLIVSDKLNHASIHDGMRLSYARSKRFKHRDYDHLEYILKRERQKFSEVFVVTESVFSMDGDCADLQKLVALKKKYNFFLYVDEAHAVGLYGESGLGKTEQYEVLQDIDCIIGTFGKGFGSIGAFIVCDKYIREYLINFSRSFIFTTALPPVVVSWNRFILDKVAGFVDKRSHLMTLSDQLREELKKYGLVTAGETNIVPVLIGDIEETVAASEKMKGYGFLTLPVRPPTVPEGESRFRLSLTADMKWEQLKNIPKLIKNTLDHAC